MTVDFSTALGAMTEAYAGVDALAASLSRHDLLAPTRCHGWVVADVLHHLLFDANRALVALVTPAPGPPDVDFATYWMAFADDNADPIPGIWAVRRGAAAFRDGVGNVMLWQDTSPAALRAAAGARPDGFIATQGHVLAVPDFLMTLATEAAIHHLDMIVNLPDAPACRPAALAAAAATLDSIAGPDTVIAANWSAEEYIMKATGRLPLTPAEQPSFPSYPLLR